MISSVAQSCLTLCDPMNHNTPGLPVYHSRKPPKPTSIESVMPSNHLILCRPLLLLPPIFPSIRVFSNESALHIRCPKYWSFSFSISPSCTYNKNHKGQSSPHTEYDWLNQAHSNCGKRFTMIICLGFVVVLYSSILIILINVD